LAVNEEELFSGSADKTAKSWSHKEDKLLWACHYGIVGIVEECLSQGANINSKDILGRTVIKNNC
jgi:ankyrin repeat protein